MRILFLCTAHNSLSQRLYLALSPSHDVTIEYAISDELMISAVALARPDLVICPFLTTLVPKTIYDNVLTLIVHPGPPGDAGPSALDWVLMGDDGSIDDANQLLRDLETESSSTGRSHWGVTVLQAIEEFDAGPVWAWDQFTIDIDQPNMTKSDLYRGPVSRAAITATLAAVARIQDAALGSGHDFAGAAKAYVGVNPSWMHTTCAPTLKPEPSFTVRAVGDNLPFQGGKLHHRPLLKAAERDFDLKKHTAQQISRRIRCGDSQPGVMSRVFGCNLYVYGGIIEDGVGELQHDAVILSTVKVLATRNEGLCIATCDDRGIWITHIRRPKTKRDAALWPKVSAVFGLLELGILTTTQVQQLHCPIAADWSLSSIQTFQEVWVDFKTDENGNRTAYLYFEFYNGAMATNQCSHLIEAMQYILARSTTGDPIRAVVLMGGAYFSNGIALNVIESSADPGTESWLNIGRIDDVVHYLLHEFPSRGILTVAAVRGNAAAGGVALATACDVVIAGSDIVLNPAYRAVGLYGSEYHTLSYYGRCGEKNATAILRAMTPMSPLQAQSIGLVDFVFPGSGKALEDSIRYHVTMLLKPGILTRGYWKANVDLSPASLARARAMELSEMCKDFWSARAVRYHTRRFDFVRKVKPSQTPLRFATHRRQLNNREALNEEELDSFDDVDYYRQRAEEQAKASLRESVRNELGLLISKWAEQEIMARSHRRGSVALLTEKETAHVALPGTERRTETVFSCYYKPVDPPLTPPVSPVQTLAPGVVV